MRNFFGFILGLMLMLAFCTSVMAAPQGFEAEGVFVMGDNDTKTQAKDFALQDAKRMSLEQAGTYLRSITQVVNGQISKDEITSIASGVIKMERIINEETKLNNGVTSYVVKARFIINSDDLQKKIETLQQSDRRQAEVQKLADLQNSYADLLAENNQLKTQLAKTDDPAMKKQLLAKTQEINTRLTATEWNNKGREFYDAGKFDNAIAAFSLAITTNPQDAYAYLNRGISYNKKRQYDLAIADFNKAIALNPQDAYAYSNRGDSYYKKGKNELGEADYSKAFALSPQDADAYYYNRGNSYFYKNNWDLAIAEYNQAILLNPKHAKAYFNRGYCYIKKKLYDLAVDDYSNVINLDSNNAAAYNNRGYAHWKNGYKGKWNSGGWRYEGYYDGAAGDFKKAMELDPGNKYFKHNYGKATAYTQRVWLTRDVVKVRD